MAKPQVQADRNSRNVKENANLIQGESRGERRQSRSKLATFCTARQHTQAQTQKREQKKARHLPGLKKEILA
ncbi:hypothetical protein [Microbulbifer agarilyticus]|uniref:hypothetical protein n=1 Tax=Microbulbifer agarilyticus TaxID=260552 RepID=UPI001C95C91C|nr:hypothetical protein [Microbulbifer agarilyticus]MBY6191482.1 hypothetical protein [Microbulbifer agarilyticus]MBY6212610.1 hypothetical protein [Microbulbifer agarilyticus]MCA0894225.1 hypothetical protein [Microbulbifer agarilyticus]MCA0901746.1 hypothetical protein [Microbulbifer agarilyticus]